MHGTYIKVEDRHDEAVSQFHHNCVSDYLLHHFYQVRHQNDYYFANAPNKNHAGTFVILYRTAASNFEQMFQEALNSLK